MSASVKKWLAQRIASIDSVQKCVVDRGADIVVYSWRGIIIHVHVLDEPIKVRNLKKLAQEATRIGVGSLFVVDARLLPPDGARLTPDEWILAVHALTDGKIYAYRSDGQETHIFQVHLKPTTKPDERDVWYGPDIALGQLPFYRLWVKMQSIKGDYLVANFAADPFWRNPDYRNGRMAADERQRAQKAGQYERYDFGYGNGPAHAISQPVPTQLEISYTLLGLKLGASCEEIKAAFRKLAMEVHPDVSNLPKDEAENKFRALNDAYNFIRDQGACT
jgi:hypothetical protein